VEFLLRELNHRSKNMLAVVQSIANRTGGSSPEFSRAFSERLRALAINQDLLASNEWHGVDVNALVKAQLQPFADVGGSRVSVEGPAARLRDAAAQALGMALHELATNACKYGALASDRGKIEVRWGVAGDEFQVSWIESGGPKVNQPSQRGFGSVVVSTLVEQSLQGQVELDYAPAGLRWRMKCPTKQALEPRQAFS